MNRLEQLRDMLAAQKRNCTCATCQQHRFLLGIIADLSRTITGLRKGGCILSVDSPSHPPEPDEYFQCGCTWCILEEEPKNGKEETT